MNKFEKQIDELLKRPIQSLNDYENALVRIYLDTKDREKNNNLSMTGLYELESIGALLDKYNKMIAVVKEMQNRELNTFTPKHIYIKKFNKIINEEIK